MLALLLVPAALATPCPTITGTCDGTVEETGALSTVMPGSFLAGQSYRSREDGRPRQGDPDGRSTWR